MQGERLRGAFQRPAAKYGVIGDLRGKGLFQAIEFVRDPATREMVALLDRSLGEVSDESGS